MSLVPYFSYFSLGFIIMFGSTDTLIVIYSGCFWLVTNKILNPSPYGFIASWPLSTAIIVFPRLCCWVLPLVV